MSKTNGKTIMIQNETLYGRFPTEENKNCTFCFQNCIFMDFSFISNYNSVEFSSINQFCGTVQIEAQKITIKGTNKTENLERFKLVSHELQVFNQQLKASLEISMISDVQHIHQSQIESMGTIILQASTDSSYMNTRIVARDGIKLSNLHGNIKLENSDLEVTSIQKNWDSIVGITICSYGNQSHMSLINVCIKTEQLEIIHPNQIDVQNTDFYKAFEQGILLSRNHEVPAQVFSYHFIDTKIVLDSFYQPDERNKTKKLDFSWFLKSKS